MNLLGLEEQSVLVCLLDLFLESCYNYQVVSALEQILWSVHRHHFVSGLIRRLFWHVLLSALEIFHVGVHLHSSREVLLHSSPFESALYQQHQEDLDIDRRNVQLHRILDRNFQPALTFRVRILLF